MAKQNLGGVYANMEFAPYSFQEYPKHVQTGPWGKYEIARDTKEEQEILARVNQKFEAHQDAQARDEAEALLDPHHESLVAKARMLGVPFNSKWSTPKLQIVINEAEKSMDDLPPEENISDVRHNQDELIARAKSLGIPATRLWGIPRLLREIAEKEQAND